MPKIERFEDIEAWHEGYISQAQFDDAYKLVESASRSVGGFMAYLRQAEFTGHKFDSRPAPDHPKLKTQSSQPL